MFERKIHVAMMAVCLVLVPGTVSAQEIGRKPFVSRDNFPADMVVYFSVRNVARLKEGLSKTLLGRLLTHSGTRRATAGLRARLTEEIENASRAFTEVTGRALLELLDLLEGEVTFALRRFGPPGLEAAFAIELGARADDILGVYSRLQRAVEQATGQSLAKRKFGDHEATVWPTPRGQSIHIVLGGHLVIATTPELLEDIVSAYAGEAGAGAWRESSVHAELQKAIPVEDPEVLFEVDLATVRTVLLSGLAMTPMREQLPGIVNFGGLRGLSSLGLSAGFRGGGLEVAGHLGTRDGSEGVLKALRQGFPGIADVDAALAKAPASAREFGACRMRLGRVLRDIDGLLRKHFPEAGGQLDQLYGLAAVELGLSIEEDLFALGDATFYSFSVDPPAGGLLPDQLILVRTREVEGYWKLVKKLTVALGGKPRRLKWRRGQLETLDFTSATAADEGVLEIFRAPLGLPAVLALVGQSYVVKSDLDDGWTVISNTPQAVRRYVDVYSTQKSLVEAAGLADLARAQVAGATMVSVGKGDSLLRAYNTLVSIASGYLGRLLVPVGFDPSQLPPGELFLKRARPGFLRLETSAEGFTVYGHRPIASARGTLVAVAAIGIVASVMLPALASGREEAYQVQCASHLKTIYVFSRMYADSHQRAFPHSPAGSVASLQMLVDYFPDDLAPPIFVCPSGQESDPRVTGGKLSLKAESCSYEIVPWRLKVTTPSAILLYEKAPHHDGGRNVMFTDGAVRFLEEREFQRRLEAERKRYGGPR